MTHEGEGEHPTIGSIPELAELDFTDSLGGKGPNGDGLKDVPLPLASHRPSAAGPQNIMFRGSGKRNLAPSLFN